MTKQLAAQLQALAEMARREDIAIEIVPNGLMIRSGFSGITGRKMQLLSYERFAMMTIDEVIQYAKGHHS